MRPLLLGRFGASCGRLGCPVGDAPFEGKTKGGAKPLPGTPPRKEVGAVRNNMRP